MRRRSRKNCLGKLWRTSVNVVPIVVEALGATVKLERECKMLGIERDVGRIQMAALFGTSHIHTTVENTQYLRLESYSIIIARKTS